MTTPTNPTKDQRRDAARDKARAMRQQAARKQRQYRILGISIGVVVLLVIALIVAVSATNSSSTTTSAARPAGVSTSGSIITAKNGAVVNKATAAHTVTIYQDYQCPICKNFEAGANTWLEAQANAGKINLAFHPIAFLDASSSGTKYSSRSANAAMCVAGEKGFDYTKFNDILYANQPEEGGTGLPDSSLIHYAKQAGASNAVTSCINNDKHAKWVSAETKTALSPKGGNVQGTPTVLVDGKVVTPEQAGRAVDLQDVKDALAAAK